MKHIAIAFRSLFKKGRSNGIKILSLGIGLALGLVLISKVCFERSFDRFYSGYDRIYRIHESIDKEGQTRYPFVPGGVAPGMQAEIPEVEVATRLTPYGNNPEELISTPDKKRYSVNRPFVADGNVFDVFSTPVLTGNPKEILERPGYVMVCRTLAEKMGGLHTAVGRQFVFDSDVQAVTYTVGGVFEDVPENAFLRYDMLLSAPVMPEWSLNNWAGNDRYYGYVKLHPGVDPDSLAPALRALVERHVDVEEMHREGVDLFFSLGPLLNQHSGSSHVKRMNVLLLFLAFVLIFTAVMNYVLVALSTLINRTKEVAVHKCYGASERNLFGIILSETFVHLLLALVAAVLLIFAFRGKVEELLDASLGALFTLPTLSVLAGVCVLVFVLAGVIPTGMFMRIPVAAAFRSYKESRRHWKLALLFVQFAATGFLVALLVVIERQYDWMVHDQPGYAYENLVYYDAFGVDPSVRESALRELEALPAVSGVTSAYQLPIQQINGNNVFLPEGDQTLFNAADLMFVNDGYFSVMEIPVVAGEVFTPGASNRDKVMVSRSFEKKMAVVAGWTDGAVGKSVFITGHASDRSHTFTVCGVYDDFRIGSVAAPDRRPSVYFYNKQEAPVLLIQLHALTPEAVQAVTGVLQRVMPDREISVRPYRADMVNLYRQSRYFRDSVMAGGMVTILIALIGLLGYTSDETNRRGREIAIRKVNGAEARDILKLMSGNITRIALPALLIGIGAAYYAGEKWLEQFAQKAPASYGIFIGAAVAVYALIVGCVVFRTWRVANENPVDSIKFE